MQNGDGLLSFFERFLLRALCFKPDHLPLIPQQLSPALCINLLPMFLPSGLQVRYCVWVYK